MKEEKEKDKRKGGGCPGLVCAKNKKELIHFQGMGAKAGSCWVISLMPGREVDGYWQQIVVIR